MQAKAKTLSIKDFFLIPAITLAMLLTIISISQASEMPDSFAPMVKDLMPSVVNISTTQTVEGSATPFEGFNFEVPPGSPFEGLPELFKRFQQFNEAPLQQKVSSLGSGFIIDASGYIVTNNHVVEKAEEISVILSDDTRLEAKVVGTDPKTDVAILKVESDKPLPAVKWGSSDDAEVGDWVIAIGNPFGLGGSVSAGIISARARDINAGPFDDFLQTDAAINRGNSGGPLFNIRGEVIGVNTAIFSPSGGNVGIGFATPSALIMPIISQLKEHGRTFRGWLGVKIQGVSEDIADSLGLDSDSGALVVEVTPDSPADKAGVSVGDVILSFKNKEVETMRKLPRMVAETKAGSSAPITVWRDGKTKKLSVKLGELPVESSLASASKPGSNKESKDLANSEELLGMWVQPLDNEHRKLLGIKDPNVEGLLVMKTDGKSEAAKKGIIRGDIIIKANQEKVSSISDLEKAISRAKSNKRKAILLLLQRGQSTQFIALPVN